MILLRRLDMTGEREINPESLIDVYSDEGFKGHLLTSFMQNTEKREKAIIYAVLLANEDTPVRGFTHEFIDSALRRQAIAFSEQAIEDACDVLVLAGILHRKGKEYFLTSPVFTKVLKRTYDLGYLFRKLKEEGL